MVESEHCVEKVISEDSEVNRNKFMQIPLKCQKVSITKQVLLTMAAPQHIIHNKFKRKHPSENGIKPQDKDKLS